MANELAHCALTFDSSVVKEVYDPWKIRELLLRGAPHLRLRSCAYHAMEFHAGIPHSSPVVAAFFGTRSSLGLPNFNSLLVRGRQNCRRRALFWKVPAKREPTVTLIDAGIGKVCFLALLLEPPLDDGVEYTMGEE